MPKLQYDLEPLDFEDRYLDPFIDSDTEDDDDDNEDDDPDSWYSIKDDFENED